MSCPHCAHCIDYTSPAAVQVGRTVPALKIPHVAAALSIAAPKGALDAILGWVEGLRGRRGTTRQAMTLVGLDDEWTKIEMAQPPLVVGGARRGNGQPIGTEGP